MRIVIEHMNITLTDTLDIWVESLVSIGMGTIGFLMILLPMILLITMDDPKKPDPKKPPSD
jgi:hypothetical protein